MVQKEMMLITSLWQGKPTFRLMSLVGNSAFIEGIYDPENKTLVMVTRDKSEAFRMIPKLDSTGDMIKVSRPRPNGKDYKEERGVFTTNVEHYLTVISEMEYLIPLIALNSEEFDYKKYLNAEPVAVPEPEKV